MALYRALETIATSLRAAGTALIRPHLDDSPPWLVEYAGTRREEVRLWLQDRLYESLEDTMLAVSEKAPCSQGAESVMLPLRPRTSPEEGLWVVWPYTDLEPAAGVLDEFRRALETLIEVERGERLHFLGNEDFTELTRALRQGDRGSLPELLGLTRQICGADLAYWGSVHDDRVDVEWHLGARDGGFGFELPLGKGVGGRAFASDETYEIPDYKNCQYRYPGVSDVTDSEDVRSTLAIPLHSADPRAGAVLYAGRRSVSPFSPAQRILLSRLARSVEPVGKPQPATRPSTFRRDADLKSVRYELRQILLNSNQVRDIESWAEQLIQGPAILADHRERPYAPGNSDRFERLRSSTLTKDSGSQKIPLANSKVSEERGHLYLWPSVDPPLSQWPDLFDDLAAACNVVLDRMEHAYDRLNHRRSHWARGMVEGRVDLQSRREGNRLGLPTDQGEIWAVAWKSPTERNPQGMRSRMLAEDLVLDLLDSPFIVLDDEVGVLLLKKQTNKKQAYKKPSFFRDELLKVLGPEPLWLVHGAVYDSFDGLGSVLRRTVKAARRIRREEDDRFISEVHSRDLDSLLENPKLSGDLSVFANNLLEPVLAYDKGNGTQMAETLCQVLTSNSTEEVAERLFVHANTVRYRARRAEEILGRDLTKPKERAAACLAAFVWLHRHSDSLN